MQQMIIIEYAIIKYRECRYNAAKMFGKRKKEN